MKLLLTGAAGGVGTMIRPLLLERYGSLVSSDMVEMKDLLPGETFVKADLGNPGEIDALTKQCDAIIHLGGISIEQPWEPILAANIAGLCGRTAATASARHSARLSAVSMPTSTG
jgi:uronate dehydrogenase